MHIDITKPEERDRMIAAAEAFSFASHRLLNDLKWPKSPRLQSGTDYHTTETSAWAAEGLQHLVRLELAELNSPDMCFDISPDRVDADVDYAAYRDRLTVFDAALAQLLEVRL